MGKDGGLGASAVRGMAQKSLVFSVTHMEDEVAAALKTFDTDGTGTISYAKLLHAAKLFSDERTAHRRAMRLALVFAGAMLVSLLANMGLTFVVVDLARQTDLAHDSGATTVRGEANVVVHTGTVDARRVTQPHDCAEADAMALEERVCLLPIDSPPASAMGDPEVRFEAGVEGTWLLAFDFDDGDGNGTVTAESRRANAEALCADLAARGGACATGWEDSAASATAMIRATMDEAALLAARIEWRADAEAQGWACGAPYGLERVSRDVRLSAPAHFALPKHTAEDAEAEHEHRAHAAQRLLLATRAGAHRVRHLVRRKALEALPSALAVGRRNSSDSEGGASRALRDIELANGPMQCFFISDAGSSYRGTRSEPRWASGKACLNWDAAAVARNGVTFTSSALPGEGLEGNFCRNPQADTLGLGVPWCFIEGADGSPEPEVCGVDPCEASAYRAGEDPVLKDPDWAWALDRLDEAIDSTAYDMSAGNWKLPAGDGLPALTGEGVHAFIFDSGLRATHTEFRGRVGEGRSCIAGEMSSDTDDNFSHGTHVAGTLAGSKWGVAPGVTIHAMRVLDDNGGGSAGYLQECVRYVLDNLEELTGGAPAVAVMSLNAAGYYESLNAIPESLAKAGVFVALAAGNSDKDACGYSPASTDHPGVVTVASTNFDDSKGTYSNWGGCVDLWAPGTGVRAAGIESDTALLSKAGTSMSAPLVAGVAALVLEAYPLATPAEVRDFLLDAAFYDEVFSHDASTYGGFRDPTEKSAVEATPNELLRVDWARWGTALRQQRDDAEDVAGGGAEPQPRPNLPLCDVAAEQGVQWRLSCPARGTVICGGEFSEAFPELRRPLRYGECSAPVDPSTGEPVCVCPTQDVVESCAQSPSDYVYITSCGLPASIIQDTEWLTGKLLVYAPRPEGDSYRLMRAPLSRSNDGAFSLPYPHYEKHKCLGDKLANGGVAKLSFATKKARFPVLNPTNGKIKSAKAFYVGANGYISLGKSQNGKLAPSLESHFDKKHSAGLSISALFAELDVEAGGDICVGSDGVKTVVTWAGVPALGPKGLSDDRAQNTVQVVLDADSGTVSVAYASVVPLLTGRAIAGIGWPQKNPVDSSWTPYDLQAATALDAARVYSETCSSVM